MKLVILDESGLELATKRVSLIDGGVEIVIAGTYGKRTTEDVPAAAEESNSSVDESTTATTAKSEPAGLFDSSSELPAAPQDDVADTTTNDASDSKPVVEETDNPCVDKTGRGWDKRIDSSSKKIVKSTGIWARRKNIADDVYAAVIAELTAAALVDKVDALPDPDALPDAPADEGGIPDAPGEEAPLPDNNVVGDSDDDALKGILSDWG